jgi:hypothetical protein
MVVSFWRIGSEYSSILLIRPSAGILCIPNLHQHTNSCLGAESDTTLVARLLVELLLKTRFQHKS